MALAAFTLSPVDGGLITDGLAEGSPAGSVEESAVGELPVSPEGTVLVDGSTGGFEDGFFVNEVAVVVLGEPLLCKRITYKVLRMLHY